MNNSFSLAAFELLNLTRKINILCSSFLVMVGLVGHSITIFVFSQKRFRTNPSNVFLLCMALNDCLFLLVHFFENTIRNYKDIYFKNSDKFTPFYELISFINITDKFQFTCSMISYLRYALRFISSYLLIAFTLHRLAIVNSPLKKKIITKKTAWNTIAVIVLTSVAINIWPVFLFELHPVDQFCDIKQKWLQRYFQIIFVYILVTIFIPIFIIIFSNIIIIKSLVQAQSKNRNLIQNSIIKHRKYSPSVASALSDKSSNIRIKPHYFSVAQLSNKSNVNSIRISTRNLLFISFVFVFLNLPYLTVWVLFIYQMEYYPDDTSKKGTLFSILQICEIFYLANFCMLFFTYCASGSRFRNQLKYSSKRFYFKLF